MQHVLNRTVTLASRNITLKPDGQVSYYVYFLRLNTTNGEFEVGFLKTLCCKSQSVPFQPAAVHSLDTNQLEIVQPELWMWRDGKGFPAGVPRCGFNGERCISEESCKCASFWRCPPSR